LIRGECAIYPIERRDGAQHLESKDVVRPTSKRRRCRAVLCALAVFACTRASEPANSAATALDGAALDKWEGDAILASLSHDADFYSQNLVDDWSGGSSDGSFQTKSMLLRELRDSTKRGPTMVCHSHMTLRFFDLTAVVTYIRTTDSHRDGNCVQTTAIETDTFVKTNGHWLQIASHTSSASRRP
jgi:hypothetical protein